MTEIKKENIIQSGATGQSTQKPLLRVEHFKESFNRFPIISLDVLICRYSP
ncbi:Uncharacterised protein [uncultured Clostridium sp.]|nr:Uncharacterised protein [uncultured Clostridium sp.]